MNRVTSLAVSALLLAGCVSIGPGPAATPTRVPTLPPVNIPSISVPTLPPIDIPSIDIAIPTAVAGAGMCRLISAEEVGAILGTPMSVSESTVAACSYLSTSTFATITLRTEPTDLDSARFLLSDPTDVNVGGNPAVIGNFMGVILYIARGPETLVVQSVLFDDTEDNRQKIIQIGTTAVSRW